MMSEIVTLTNSVSEVMNQTLSLITESNSISEMMKTSAIHNSLKMRVIH